MAGLGLGDGVLLLRFDCRHRAAGPYRAGVPPVSLPSLRQAVQRAQRWAAEPHAVPIRRHRPVELRKLVAVCGGDLPGLRDRALLLLSFAGALRRSELVGIDREHLRRAL